MFRTIFKKYPNSISKDNRESHSPTVNELTNKMEELLFHSIVGYYDIKKLLMRSILSKEQTHVLLIGPPATSKTIFLLEMFNELSNAYFIDGTATSGIGIVDFLFSHPETRFILIDEIDKLNKKDQTVLYNLMETGILTEMKAEKTKGFRQQKMNVKIFATSNELDKLTQPLKSRFLKLELPEYSWDEFLTISNNLIKSRYKHLNEQISNRIAEIVWQDLKTKDIRDCLQIAKLAYSIEDAEDIAHTLLKYKPNQN
ncbi:MAG TPA: AAA family ATPase [Nitrososphaeraceae archaeon]|nr:AAA family ATPase [Nitrososphaeraceae archaeon]